MTTNATFADRVLAEAVRAEEERQGFLHPNTDSDPTLDLAAADLETRVTLRAAETPASAALRKNLLGLRQGLLLATAVAALVAVFAGAGTAAAALGSGGGLKVNIYVALSAVLGVNLLALVAWLVLVAIRPGADATTSLGGLVWLVSRPLARWMGGSAPGSGAALKALAVSGTRSGAARWLLSAISHGFWVAFIVGAVVASTFLLGTRQYVFTWETTILSADTFVPLTQTIAKIPSALGFPVPGLEEIVASQWRGNGSIEPSSAAESWSGLLIGSILVYGLLPRLLLLVLCLTWAAGAAKRYRLDLNLPAFAMVAKRLDPAARRLGITDADIDGKTEREPEPRPPVADAGNAAGGPPAIVGLEIEPPSSGWPPLSDTLEWLDLGTVDSREQRQAAIERLTAALPPPREVVIVCSLASTPDRGSERFIGTLSAGRTAALLLSEGDRLRRSGASDRVERRAADWRSAATHGGIAPDRVLEVDLEHLTEHSARRLRQFLAADRSLAPTAKTKKNHLAQAFAQIVETTKDWKSPPDTLDQAELHRKIASIYRGRGEGWKVLLGANRGQASDPLTMLTHGADRMMEILPERLRGSRDWIASGAVAGAMACVAAATLATPVALAALPVWAGMGGALSLMLKTRLDRSGGEQEPTVSKADIGEAVRAGALFAVLLELQGLDEAEITRRLDQVFDTEVPQLRTTADAEGWLQNIKGRVATAGDLQ